jgi:glutamate/tyrosine decarboxylase-like PLP-dependent enzyme
VLAELLTAAVNPNVGAWVLSPMASEIEAQTVRWIAELIGHPEGCGGLLVSGGNMANIVAVAAARKAKASPEVGAAGVQSGTRRLRIYASTETHTWLQKTVDLLGLGADDVRWLPTDDHLRIDTTKSDRQWARAAGRVAEVEYRNKSQTRGFWCAS